MKFIINGGHKLSGKVTVSGAKNTALKVIAASVLIQDKVVLKNVPRITDVENMAKIIEYLGGKVKWDNNVLTLNCKNLNKFHLPEKITNKLRGAIVFIGPLLARFNHAILPFPGGCNIGKRPLTAHTGMLAQFKIKINKNKYRYSFQIDEHNKLEQNDIILSERSVTATENAVLYAAYTPGHHKLSNIAAEPEIDDLILFLNKAGANIKRISHKVIVIEGQSNLISVEYNIAGDRIEAGTWIITGLLTGQKIEISGFNPNQLKTPISLLKKSGAKIKENSGSVIVKDSSLNSFDLSTGVYPGFPTDLQSPAGLLMTQAKGKSILNENLFEDRLKYLEELKDMGAKIKIINKHKAIINGPTELKGKIIESTDLRAGATMVLAGLIASGQTTVQNAEVIDRGYEKIDDKLLALGARIKRMQ